MAAKKLVGTESPHPYSPALVVGDLAFVSGQGPIDSNIGQVAGATIEEQTRLTLQNVQRLLHQAGCSMDDCVKVTVHLLDMQHFDRFNVVYRTFFTRPYPTRTTVQSVLWSGILVEIDVIAVRQH